jgi:hypothetical protein
MGDGKHAALGLAETSAACLSIDLVEVEDHFTW